LAQGAGLSPAGAGGLGVKGGGAAFDDRQDVVAGDAAPRTGAGDLSGVELVLGEEPAHDRREQPARVATV
jgi:hypothetical protein